MLFGLILYSTLVSAPLDTVVQGTYARCGLRGVMSERVFEEAYEAAMAQDPGARILMIADMSQPSTAQRLYVIDLEQHKLLLKSWVAHGKGSGDLRCEKVSDVPGSLCTSRGLFRIGERIVSPKHGDALLLHGLQRGVNDHAIEREIIMHAADYVSAGFIAEHGRLGRSWGCPAVTPEVMRRLLSLLLGDALYYVYAH